MILFQWCYYNVIYVVLIVASGCPPVMSHVRITVELSFIGPDGVCIIDGVDVGSSKIR
jgi:hypothetical protein